MRIKIVSTVNNDIKSIFAGFDKELFLKLAPPFPPVRLLRFDGCQKGDEVHLEILIPFIPQRWDALITDFGASDSQIFFIDEGTRLPFFLKTWRHWHGIQQSSELSKSLIIDDFEYTTPYKLLDYVMYPVLYLQFLYRKPVYKRIFNRN